MNEERLIVEYGDEEISTMATNKLKDTTPFRAVHPSEILKDEIKARGMSQKELAARMGMQQSNLSRLLKGENITLPIAQKIELAIGVPADFWMRLQAQYSRDYEAVKERDSKEVSAIDLERELAGILNLPELYKRLGINTASFVHEKMDKLESLLEVSPLEICNHLIAQIPCYKKSDKYEVDTKNQATWLTLAYIESRNQMPEATFNIGDAKLAASEISQAVHEGQIKEADIKSILNKYAIAYSVVGKLDKTPIDAVSMCIGGKPAIITTHRYNDMSRLVFDIMHELGHIELHMFNGQSSIFISNDATYSTANPMELEANKFAQDALINPEVWDRMMSVGAKDLRIINIASSLKRLSKENHLNYNIVAWRYRYESNNYQFPGLKPERIL